MSAKQEYQWKVIYKGRPIAELPDDIKVKYIQSFHYFEIYRGEECIGVFNKNYSFARIKKEAK